MSQPVALIRNPARIIESPLPAATTGMTDAQADAFRFLRSQNYAAPLNEFAGRGGLIQYHAAAGPEIDAVMVTESILLTAAINTLLAGNYITAGRRGSRILYYRMTAQAALDYNEWFLTNGARKPDPHSRPLPSRNPIKRYPVVTKQRGGVDVLSQRGNDSKKETLSR